MKKPKHPLTLGGLRPRNRFAIAASQQRAGSHRSSTGASRQDARRRLMRELGSLHPPHY